MLSLTWITVSLIFTQVLGTPQPPSCPLQCKCAGLKATCTDLDFSTSFPNPVLQLKISNPSKPIVLTNNTFARAHLQLVNTIHVENATIKEIQPLVFNELPELKVLVFENSILLAIGRETFVNSMSLELLNFKNCNLSNFESLVSTTISQLYLTHCGLKKISKTMFADLPKLTLIGLSNNEISEMDEDAFENLEELEEVQLDNNKLNKIPEKLFADNDGLSTLDLSGNPMMSLQSIDNAEEVEKLTMRNGILEQFQGENYIGLSYLDLSNNSIYELSVDAFTNIQDLEYIDLSRNKLKSIHGSIFANNSRLQKIILDHNQLYTLPEFVNGEIFETYMFSCGSCELEEIKDETFHQMTGLVILMLTNNRIGNLNPEMFKYLPSLSVLDVSYNMIISLQTDVFRHTVSLSTVNIAGNSITHLDARVFEPTELKSLDVSNNALMQIWITPTATKLPSLRVLDLRNNKLTNISETELNVMEYVDVLNVVNNPIDCEKEMKVPIEWLKRHSVSPVLRSTHEKMYSEYEFVDDEENLTWDDICNYEYYMDVEETDDDSDRYYFNDQLFSNDLDEFDYLKPRFSTEGDFKRHRYSFVWPMLVFIITALFVLLLVSNIILCVMRKRGQLPRNITLPWKNNNNNNGFVYKPLSEEYSTTLPVTNIDTSYGNYKQMPIVHKSRL